jgi:small subunit ribosomal protein S17
MKIFTGKVVSVKMQKTATVVVDRVIVHPVYGKRVKRTEKYQVHNEFDVIPGQRVKFVASKPYSKTKKWKITGVIAEKKEKSKHTGKEKK